MSTIIGKAFLAIVILFSAVYIPLQIPSIKSSIFPTSSPTPTPKSIPTFEEWQKQNQPSDRALKTASTIYISVSKSEQQKLEHQMLATGSASLTVNRLAKEFDADPAKMALAEAWIQKNLNGQVSTDSDGNDYSAPQPIAEPTTNTGGSLQKYQADQKQQCQDQINKYTICLADYNAKLNDYQECYSRYSGNSNLHPEFLCSKPSNFCYKPACAY